MQLYQMLPILTENKPFEPATAKSARSTAMRMK